MIIARITNEEREREREVEAPGASIVSDSHLPVRLTSFTSNVTGICCMKLLLLLMMLLLMLVPMAQQRVCTNCFLFLLLLLLLSKRRKRSRLRRLQSTGEHSTRITTARADKVSRFLTGSIRFTFPPSPPLIKWKIMFYAIFFYLFQRFQRRGSTFSRTIDKTNKQFRVLYLIY